MITSFEGKITEIDREFDHMHLCVDNKHFVLWYDNKNFEKKYIRKIKKGVTLRVWCIQTSSIFSIEMFEDKGFKCIWSTVE